MAFNQRIPIIIVWYWHWFKRYIGKGSLSDMVQPKENERLSLGMTKCRIERDGSYGSTQVYTRAEYFNNRAYVSHCRAWSSKLYKISHE